MKRGAYLQCRQRQEGSKQTLVTLPLIPDRKTNRYKLFERPHPNRGFIQSPSMETEAFSSSCFCLSAFHLKHPPFVVHSAGKGYKMDRRNRQRVQQSFAEPFVIHISVSVELDFWVSASRHHPIILHHCYPLINLLITFN